MEKANKRIESVDDEIPLPEPMIQHIQSFLTELQAVKTTILSKSWYNAWLTRPSLNIDEHEFNTGFQPQEDAFKAFAKKTMQRYQNLSLKIESLRLRSRYHYNSLDTARNMITNVMKIGATNVELQLLCKNTLPREVFGSENLLRLSVRDCKVDGNHVISCSRLKSLVLKDVEFTGDSVFKDIFACCVSMEELSLSYCNGVVLKQMNMYELHKFTRLLLEGVDVDSMFFTDFTSRFPCLKDLSVLYCSGFTKIHIVSTSLETISFKMFKESWKCRAKFDVPNIRKFTCYSGSGLPALSINGASREWELDISICFDRFHKKSSWFLNLKKLLTKFRLSRISLSMNLKCLEHGRAELEVDVEVVPKPRVVENLTIDAPPTFIGALLVQLFGIFRPKFITYCWWRAARCYHGWGNVIKEESIDILCKRLMQQVVTPNSAIPDQYIVGQFNLKKVKVEVHEMIDSDTEWRPLVLKSPLDASETSVNKRKVRFELFWD